MILVVICQYKRVAALDSGLSALINDPKSSGLFTDTLIVMAGEFGRTAGKLSAAAGRDHYPQQFAFFAGSGIKGGQVIGSTDATGSATVDPETGTKTIRDIKEQEVFFGEIPLMGRPGRNYSNEARPG